MKPNLLFETIRCEDGLVTHLPYHQERLIRSLSCLGSHAYFNLEKLITPPHDGLYRCRFLYDATDYHIEFHPYTPRVINSLRLVDNDAVHYPLKYVNRDQLDNLFTQRDGCDDVLIVKEGILRDTTVANIALYIEGHWLTPQLPLLYGTTRQRLLHEGFIEPALLTPNDVHKAQKVAIMNAMVGFVEIENGIIT